MKSVLKTMAMVVVVSLGCRGGSGNATPAPAAQPEAVTAGADGRVTVRVDGEGYHPATIRAAAGRALTLVFLRTTDETCGQKLRIASMNIERDLPLNQPVEVAVNAPASGSLGFTCGMNMYRGQVVVQ